MQVRHWTAWLRQPPDTQCTRGSLLPGLADSPFGVGGGQVRVLNELQTPQQVATENRLRGLTTALGVLLKHIEAYLGTESD